MAVQDVVHSKAAKSRAHSHTNTTVSETSNEEANLTRHGESATGQRPSGRTKRLVCVIVSGNEFVLYQSDVM